MGQCSSFQPRVVSSTPPTYTYYYLYDFFNNKVLEVQRRFIKEIIEYDLECSNLKNVKIIYHSGREEFFYNIRYQGTYEKT
jgi:hypothetical protein